VNHEFGFSVNCNGRFDPVEVRGSTAQNPGADFVVTFIDLGLEQKGLSGGFSISTYTMKRPAHFSKRLLWGLATQVRAYTVKTRPDAVLGKTSLLALGGLPGFFFDANYTQGHVPTYGALAQVYGKLRMFDVNIVVPAAEWPSVKRYTWEAISSFTVVPGT
jgi:hypothetical protein